MPIKRKLTLTETLTKKSCFLFGARQSGKSTLIDSEFKDAFKLSLLDLNLRRELIQNPNHLKKIIPPNEKLVVIDEIQKIPELLDLIHLLIEERKIHFLLTGSSAIKLRRSGVNFLGGRARTRYLFPFIQQELGTQYSLEKAANVGLIPSIYLSEEPHEDLKSYVSEYLIQEIAAEGISRNIPSFSRFLEVAALCNAQLLNYQNVGSDSEVKRGTVKNYYDILEETLIGYRLPAWQKSKKRKAISTEKFYFFDVGIVNSLLGRKTVSLSTPDGGYIFETLIMHEVRSWIEYTKQDYKMSFWRSTSGFEVDLLLNDEIAIEIKAKKKITPKDLAGLKALKEEQEIKKMFVIYLGDTILHEDEITILPFQNFIDQMWNKF